MFITRAENKKTKRKKIRVRYRSAVVASIRHRKPAWDITVVSGGNILFATNTNITLGYNRERTDGTRRVYISRGYDPWPAVPHPIKPTSLVVAAHPPAAVERRNAVYDTLF